MGAVSYKAVVEEKLKCLEGQPADAVEKNDNEHHANDLFFGKKDKDK